MSNYDGYDDDLMFESVMPDPEWLDEENTRLKKEIIKLEAKIDLLFENALYWREKCKELEAKNEK